GVRKALRGASRAGDAVATTDVGKAAKKCASILARKAQSLARSTRPRQGVGTYDPASRTRSRPIDGSAKLGRLRRRAIVEHLGKRAQAANRVALFGNVATQQGPRLSID